MHHRFDERRQRNREEYAPESPQTAKNHHRQNNHQRMQVNRFREQYRYQQVAIQRLNNQVHRKQAPELGSRAKLEQRHAHHRNGDHKRADIGINTENPTSTASSSE